MVFWKTYPLSTWIHTLFPSFLFQDLRFEKEMVESPTGYEAEMMTDNSKTNRTDIRHFLKTHFGNPPFTPVLDIPEMELLQKQDILFFVKDPKETIAGCIRYHFVGTFENHPMYIVDCFCIHPSWRKKGVGDYLLTILHHYVNANNIPYCLFLKEGSSLPILSLPMYSSRYVFKRIEYVESYQTRHISHLSIKQAHKAIDIFQQINPSLFIIRNREKTSNQTWMLYKNGMNMIIACVQDTYQWFTRDGQKKRIGWITGWIESPGISSSIKADASHAIADSMCDVFDYIWTNEEWTGYSDQWTIDGSFHWYTYQWATNLNIKKQYCIIN